MTTGAAGVATPLALQERYEQWFAALAQGRRSEVEATLAPDFRYTDLHGVVWDRDAYLGLFEFGAPTRPAVVTRLHVRDMGGHAVADGAYSLEATDDRGRAVILRCHFNALWRRGQDGWACVLHHTTDIQAP